MAKLYDLVGSYARLMESADSDAEGFSEILETISDAIDGKLESCAKVIKNLATDIDALKTEEARLAKRRKSIESNIGRLKDYMHVSMNEVNKTKVKTALFTIYISKGKPTLEILNEQLIPEKYYGETPPPPLDKRSLLDDLKAGEQVDGVQLGTTDATLQIR